MNSAIFIFRPFLYLTVRHESKVPQIINWSIPLVFSATFVAFYYFNVENLNIFGGSGFLVKVLGLMQSLAGFYIAALAAVAALNNPNMDEPMPGKPPVMNIIYNNGIQEIELTRRRYMCSMFSYLTAACLILCLAIIFSTSFNDYAKSILSIQVVLVLKLLSTAVIFFILTQMMIVTFWGLYYLGEKVHTGN